MRVENRRLLDAVRRLHALAPAEEQRSDDNGANQDPQDGFQDIHV
jgi:hypothetical protein